MGWKDLPKWPTWLIVVIILIALISLPFAAISFLGKVLGCPYQPPGWILPGAYNCEGIKLYLSVIIHFGIFFIIGTLIAWIIGKIKQNPSP